MRYGWLLFALVRCPLCLCCWPSAASSAHCSCVAGGRPLYCSSFLQGLVGVAVAASLSLLTLSQHQWQPTPAPSVAVVVVVVVPGGGVGLLAGAKPWRRTPCWSSSASSRCRRRRQSRDDDSDGGGGQIAEEVNIVVTVAF
jgi:hypothetical protein